MLLQAIMEPMVIGLDYGTDSARAVLVRVRDGKELRSAVFNYPRWSKGMYCDPVSMQYRQHPRDYIEAAEVVINRVLEAADTEVRHSVVGIAFDTTGSTPCMVDEACMPLALSSSFADNPNAMFVLWKDHTSVEEATAINALAHKTTPDYTSFCGGTYSSEWFWSKALHLILNDEKVCQAAYGVVECSEWLPALFTGVTSYKNIVRSRCACGHKAMWHESWGGFPPRSFFDQLHPRLGLFRSRMSDTTETVDKPVGSLCEEWSIRLGLSRNVVVAGGGIDAHLGALGAGIKPHSFVRVMGTSTCDMMVIESAILGQRCVKGICGQVNGSIVPNMIGLEAGQSAYGDVFAWFSKLLQYSSTRLIARSTCLDETSKVALLHEIRDKMLLSLSEEASQIRPCKYGVHALDWFNGRRTPDANQNLKSVIGGLTLGSDAPSVYRALIEATAYGSRAIVERFRREGVRIDNVIAVGGIAKRSPLVIQILADVLNIPIAVCESEQICALGAAIAAATAAGCYANIPEAQEQMASRSSMTYKPCPAMADLYDTLYKQYMLLAANIERMHSHM